MVLYILSFTASRIPALALLSVVFCDVTFAEKLIAPLGENKIKEVVELLSDKHKNMFVLGSWAGKWWEHRDLLFWRRQIHIHYALL